MGRKRRKKRTLGRILLLAALIWAAYRYLDVTDETRVAINGPNPWLEGTWRAHDERYEDIIVVIDADSVRVLDGREELCDEEYSLNERTLLVTSAYRQDFGSFALFEYRSGADGVNGKPVLVGSAILSEGGYEEIFFTKD